MMQFTDSHCHLDDVAFSEKLSVLLAQCQQLNVNRIIIPSIKPENFGSVLSLVKQYHNNPIELYPALGIHPWFLTKLNITHLELLNQKVQENITDIIAIGEIGIDGAIVKRAEDFQQTPEESLAQQQHFFDYQLNIAKETDLPVIVHHRQSHDKIIPFLRKYKLPKSGVIHGFSGSYQQGKDYIDLGFKLGVGGTITYPRAKKTINAIKRFPLDSLVLETDAPSMPLNKAVITVENQLTDPVSKSLVNSPVNITKIFEVLTSIRTESAIEIANQLEMNINKVFLTPE